MNEPWDEETDGYYDDAPPADDRNEWDHVPPFDNGEHVMVRRWDGGTEHYECHKCHASWPCPPVERAFR